MRVYVLLEWFAHEGSELLSVHPLASSAMAASAQLEPMGREWKEGKDSAGRRRWSRETTSEMRGHDVVECEIERPQ